MLKKKEKYKPFWTLPAQRINVSVFGFIPKHQQLEKVTCPSWKTTAAYADLEVFSPLEEGFIFHRSFLNREGGTQREERVVVSDASSPPTCWSLPLTTAQAALFSWPKNPEHHLHPSHSFSPRFPSAAWLERSCFPAKVLLVADHRTSFYFPYIFVVLQTL